MKKQPSKKALSINELNPDKVLGRWLAAVSALQQHYNQLSNHITINGGQDQALPATRCIGQCTLHQLMDVLDRLHMELEELLQDIKQPEQPDSQDNFEKLATHILKLEELNQQAQVLLHLATLPAS